jgi:hypothetical protein
LYLVWALFVCLGRDIFYSLLLLHNAFLWVLFHIIHYPVVRLRRFFDMTSLEIAVQAPSVVRLGATLNPPLAVAMRSTTAANGYISDLSRFWALATLIDYYGEVLEDHLFGSRVESASTPRNGDDSIDYFLFDNLSIECIGSFRIRVTLMRMDKSAVDATTVQQVESNLIVVEDREVERAPPSKTFGEIWNDIADFVTGASEQRLLDSLI